jgi:antitoxin (DNA-binding transcriptional repressor) of toxin-antitoxin stability system
MEFVAARDFRTNPGDVWKKLKENRKLIITNNGKPIALLSDIEGGDLESELRAQAIADMAVSISKLREQARRSGADRMTEKEIEAEIQAARKGR